MTRIASPLLALALALSASLAQAAGPLSVAEVEKATGLTGLHTATAKYDKTGINVLDAKGQIVVSIKDQPASVYEVWKQAMPGQAVSGLGDAAFQSKTGSLISVCFKKAVRGVCVSGSTSVVPGSAAVTEAQLMDLARTAASHL